MKLFDLHCDTISKCLINSINLINGHNHICIDAGLDFECWVQTFALWIDDKYKGQDAYDNLICQYNFYALNLEEQPHKLKIFDKNNLQKNVCNAMLSLENASALNGDIKNISLLKDMGVKIVTLVWNDENELGGGVLTDIGLKPFGRQVVKCLEENDIIVDVSHLNQRGFFDLCEIATKPFIATHSNSLSVCNNPRNLSDEQFTYIAKNGGVVGINFYPLFVNGSNDCSRVEIFKHIDKFLELGGENSVALGSDFDGADMSRDLNKIKKLEKFYEDMIKYYNEDLVNKIFYDNAMNFFGRVQ